MIQRTAVPIDEAARLLHLRMGDIELLVEVGALGSVERDGHLLVELPDGWGGRASWRAALEAIDEIRERQQVPVDVVALIREDRESH